jgi:hypothetical protein
MIRELRQFAHRVSIPEPSVELLRDHFEGDHRDSVSDAPRRLESQPPSKGGGPPNLGLEHFDYYPAVEDPYNGAIVRNGEGGSLENLLRPLAIDENLVGCGQRMGTNWRHSGTSAFQRTKKHCRTSDAAAS